MGGQLCNGPQYRWAVAFLVETALQPGHYAAAWSTLIADPMVKF
jgi:hypothetical protein